MHEEDENGARRWDGIVMYGTARGILKKLPKDQRPTVMMRGVKNISDMHFIMPMAPHREFIDAIFLSAKHNEGKNTF